jgi:hypothetical protein
MTGKRLLTAVLVVISIYHVLVGALPFLPSHFAAWIVKSVFGMTVLVSDQLHYVAKLMGIYMIVFGVFAGIAARDPARHRDVIDVGMLLYALRLINRLVFASQVRTAFEVPPVWMWIEVALLLFFGGALWLLRPRVALAR